MGKRASRNGGGDRRSPEGTRSACGGTVQRARAEGIRLLVLCERCDAPTKRRLVRERVVNWDSRDADAATGDASSMNSSKQFCRAGAELHHVARQLPSRKKSTQPGHVQKRVSSIS